MQCFGTAFTLITWYSKCTCTQHVQRKVWTCIYGTTYNIWQIYNYVWNSTIQLTSVGLIQEFPQLSTLLWRTALLAVRYRKSGNFRSRIQLKMPVCHYSLGSPSRQCHMASIDPPTHYSTISIWSRSHMRLHLLISVVAHTSEAPYTYSCVILPLCHKYSHCHEHTAISSLWTTAYATVDKHACPSFLGTFYSPVHTQLSTDLESCVLLTISRVYTKTRKQTDITHPLVIPSQVFIPYHSQAAKL